MANESTAIHDLLSGISRKAIQDDPDDDLLFAGSRREPAAPRAPQQPRAGMFTLPPPPPPPVMPIAPMGAGTGPSPFAAPPARMATGTAPPPMGGPVVTAMPPMAMDPMRAAQTIVPLPVPFQRQPTHAIREATARVSRTAAWSIAAAHNKKLYAIPVGLFVVVVVLLGVYITSGDKKPVAAPHAVAAAPADESETSDQEPAKPSPKAEAEAPTATPIETAPAAAPTVTPIEAAPAVEVAAAEPAPAEPAAAPEAAPAAAPAAAEAAPAVAAAEPVAEPPAEPTAQQKDLIVPPTVVAASAFTARTETTVPTVTSTPIESAAPTVPTIAKAEPKAAAPAPVKVAKVAKKSKRELARERRAAKRAAKHGAKPRVAEVEKVEKADKPEKAEKAVAKPDKADLNGNGALAISSAEPREVWVDGRNSKRMTPLRVLLKPGKHKVTLFDKEHGNAKTFEVEVKPDTTTKLSK